MMVFIESPLFSRHDDNLAPPVEMGTLATGTSDPKKLCPNCREEAKLFGAAALFGMGELGN
jgi:hypothetical protein